jgi:hypothetical protein
MITRIAATLHPAVADAQAALTSKKLEVRALPIIAPSIAHAESASKIEVRPPVTAPASAPAVIIIVIIVRDDSTPKSEVRPLVIPGALLLTTVDSHARTLDSAGSLSEIDGWPPVLICSPVPAPAVESTPHARPWRLILLLVLVVILPLRALPMIIIIIADAHAEDTPKIPPVTVMVIALPVTASSHAHTNDSTDPLFLPRAPAGGGLLLLPPPAEGPGGKEEPRPLPLRPLPGALTCIIQDERGGQSVDRSAVSQ